MRLLNVLAAGLLALWPMGPQARADGNPLVGGHWLTTYEDPSYGHPGSYAYDLRFEPDNRATMTLAVTNSVSQVLFRYTMTGPASFESIAVDYAPKQNCAAVCLPLPPFIPMGTVSRCDFQIEGGIILLVDCHNGEIIRYTRQN